MNTRILHCSTSLENYYLCLEHRVAGFSNRGPQPGDLVYLAVKVGKKSLCGTRFVLDEPTNNKPWADALDKTLGENKAAALFVSTKSDRLSLWKNKKKHSDG